MKRFFICAMLMACSCSFLWGQNESDYVYLKSNLKWVENKKLSHYVILNTSNNVVYTGYVNEAGQPEGFGTATIEIYSKQNVKTATVYATGQFKNGMVDGQVAVREKNKDGWWRNYGSYQAGAPIGYRWMSIPKTGRILFNSKDKQNTPTGLAMVNDDGGTRGYYDNENHPAHDYYLQKLYTNNLSVIKQKCEEAGIRYVENMECPNGTRELEDKRLYTYSGGWKNGHPYYYGAYYDNKFKLVACGNVSYDEETKTVQLKENYESYGHRLIDRVPVYVCNEISINGDTTFTYQSTSFYEHYVRDKNGIYKEKIILSINNGDLDCVQFMKNVDGRPWGIQVTNDYMFEGFIDADEYFSEGRGISTNGELRQIEDGRVTITFSNSDKLTIYKQYDYEYHIVLGKYVFTNGEYSIGWFNQDPDHTDGYKCCVKAAIEYFSDGEMKRTYGTPGYMSTSELTNDVNEILDIENAPISGESTYTFKDGTTYTGEWLSHQPHGKGVMTKADGSICDGEWKYGELWNGFICDKTEKKEFNNGKYIRTYYSLYLAGDIQKTVSKSNESSYNYKYEGYDMGDGTLTYKDGTILKGQFAFKESKLSIANVESFQDINGNVLYGKYSVTNNIFEYIDSIGQISYADATKYEGGVKNGKRDGKGTLSFANGDMIHATWIDNKLADANITYIWSDGRKYVGTSKKGKFDKGTFYKVDGTIADKKEIKTWIMNPMNMATVVIPSRPKKSSSSSSSSNGGGFFKSLFSL